MGCQGNPREEHNRLPGKCKMAPRPGQQQGKPRVVGQDLLKEVMDKLKFPEDRPAPRHDETTTPTRRLRGKQPPKTTTDVEDGDTTPRPATTTKKQHDAATYKIPETYKKELSMTPVPDDVDLKSSPL